MTRLQRLQILLQEAGLEAAVLNPGPSLFYLTGLHFHLMERPVVLLATAEGETAFILPELEIPKLQSLPFKARAFPYGESLAQWQQSFSQAVQSLRLQKAKLAAEALHLRLLELNFLQKAAPDAHFLDAGALFAELRLQKDEDEIAAIQRAIAVAETALRHTLPMIHIGMTEKDIAAELTLQLIRHGSEGDFPFPPIVSGGPNGANPHASPSNRPLAAGDLLVIDWGARVDGYISDITRTFAVGEVDEEARRIYELVRRANAAGRAAARKDAPCAEVDRAARQVIARGGYGDFFIHRTGHGIGLEAHEPPWMRGDNLRPLSVGMAFTVEPGIYLPGRYGVRIEDDVMIDAQGLSKTLTTWPRDLEVID